MHMNLDFGAQPGFSIYVVLLALSGVFMLTLAGTLGRARRSMLVLNLLFGMGFIIYGGYLAFFFAGGTYVIFLKAFVLPVVMLIATVRGAAGRRRPAAGTPTVGIPGLPVTPPPTAAPSMPGQGLPAAPGTPVSGLPTLPVAPVVPPTLPTAPPSWPQH